MSVNRRYVASALALMSIVFPAFAQPFQLMTAGYDMHTEVNWPAYPQADRYEVYRRGPGESDFGREVTTAKVRFLDWTGRIDATPQTYAYYVRALAINGSELGRSDTVSVAVAPMTEEGWLDMVQQYTLRYFWEYAHPVSGMARERLGSDDVVTTGGTGFGVMAILTGIHRGWISREDGLNRLLQMVSFLQFADKYHGVFPHWINGQTGKTIPFSALDNGGDLVETAFLFEGLFCARTFFDRNTPAEKTLRAVITGLWEDIEWDHYTRNNSGVLYWHWSPTYAWQMNFPIRGFNEAMMPYLLGIASPTHPIPPGYWRSGWAGPNYVNGFSWYNYKLFVGPSLGGPLFFAQYSFQGFDPRNIRDDFANYFLQNRNHTLINRAWCIDNPLNHPGYSADCWGLTASDNPWGYSAHAPGGATDNGTITPTAALSSMPYTPQESLDALIHFYRVYGENLWGEYGFKDAFNKRNNWFASSYLAIDQGPIVNMIENYRSGLLWSLFMANPEIAPALEAIGFRPDVTDVTSIETNSIDWSVSPSPTDGIIHIRTAKPLVPEAWYVRVTTQEGRIVLQADWPAGLQEFRINLKLAGCSAGLYHIALQGPAGRAGTKTIFLR